MGPITDRRLPFNAEEIRAAAIGKTRQIVCARAIAPPFC
jgi:hypothetical protein